MFTRRLPTARVLLACVALAAGVAGCGGDDGGIDENADLVVYSGRSEALVGELIERFEADSGLDVTVRYGDSSELAAILREEGDRSPADLAWMQDAGSLDALAEAELLRALPAATTESVVEEFRGPDNLWTGTSARARVIAFDTRALKAADVPTSVFDLTDPKWRGKVGWAPSNASFQSFVTAMRAAEGEERTKQWLQAMADNGTVRLENNIATRDAIARGELQLGLINHYYVAEAIAEDPDYPVGVVSPAGDIGAMVNVAGTGILASSEHGPAAERFVAFLLSESAQRFFVDDLKEYAVVPGQPTPSGVTPLAEIERPEGVDLTELSDHEGTVTLLQDAGLL